MKKRGKLLLLVGLIFCLFFIPLVLAIPQDFTINGRLTNPSGVAEEGSYTINF